jgi:hypothetical protein
MADMSSAHTILVGNSAGKRSLGRPRREWRVILKRVFAKKDFRRLIELMWLRDRWLTREHGVETSGSIKGISRPTEQL